MLSTEFYSRFEIKILKQSLENLRLFGIYQKGYLRSNFIGVLSFLAGIILVAFLTRLWPGDLNETPCADPHAECCGGWGRPPLATRLAQ